jgi:HemY protein
MPDHVESALALAQASLDARDFPAARTVLTPYLTAPTRRVATLMAEIEEADGDIGRSREWMARAMRAAPDPVWTADGAISEQWLPVSPVTGKLDAFQWKVPVAEIGFERAPIEPDKIAAPAEKAPTDEETSSPVDAASPKPRRKSPPRRLVEKPAEPVIPIVHAPDDPGPDSALESDPVPEPTTASSGNAWNRLRQLFR